MTHLDSSVGEGPRRRIVSLLGLRVGVLVQLGYQAVDWSCKNGCRKRGENRYISGDHGAYLPRKDAISNVEPDDFKPIMKKKRDTSLGLKNERTNERTNPLNGVWKQQLRNESEDSRKTCLLNSRNAKQTKYREKGGTRQHSRPANRYVKPILPQTGGRQGAYIRLPGACTAEQSGEIGTSGAAPSSR